MNWYKTQNKREAIPLTDIPEIPYARFYQDALELLSNDCFHCVHYFGLPDDRGVMFYCLLANDESGRVWISSWHHDYYSEEELPALSAVSPGLHPFERAITENFGLSFTGSPYDKPLRYAHDRMDRSRTLNNYPFYRIEAPSLHEVNVGPIHAGIIEPGVFRFICNGERVLHLEIVLGFQHRGIERLIRETSNGLRQTALVEQVAGDTTVSHTMAFCHVVEGLLGHSSPQLDRERAIAQELERVAVHVGDMAALSMDVGFQLGQVACEALRTIIINTTQRWCGNRFGKGLIRPFGTNYPLTAEIAGLIVDQVKEVRRRYREVCEDLFTTPSVLARFEDCCAVSRSQMVKIGGVGMAARASGFSRDIRKSHPYGVYSDLIAHEPVVLETGDVMARAMMRYREVMQSIDYILKLLREIPTEGNLPPVYYAQLPARSLSFALVEGWRGEICHVGITDATGRWAGYQIKDPSLHNWYALSVAVRGAGISDFPVCNKSFDLSYCGHDL